MRGEDAGSLYMSPEQAETLAKIANRFLRAEPIPYGPIGAPPYKTYMSTTLNLRRKTSGVQIGYFRGAMPIPEAFVLTEKVDGKDMVWMSDTPMERESHMAHIQSAQGNVVICGLGMGLVLWNIALKPEVGRIFVIERNRALISAFRKFAQYDRWPKTMTDRIQFRIADVEVGEVLDLPTIDYMYCDTWDALFDRDALRITQRCYHHLLAGQRPRYVGMWGQELEFAQWCASQNQDVGTVGIDQWEAFKKDAGLPFLVPPGMPFDVYYSTCYRAAVNLINA